MPIKSILCVYGGTSYEEQALAASLSLSAQFQAEVRFLHISVPLDVYPELYGITLYGQAVSGDIGVLDSIAEANEAQRQVAQASVMAAASACNIPFSRETCAGPASGGAAAVFCPVTARTQHCLPAIGRLADVIVMGREKARQATDLEAILCGLFDTGRPVLVVPDTDDHDPRACFTEKMAIAWDGSLPAARALYASLPLLQQAKHVEIICIRPASSEPDFNSNVSLAHWLDLHGLPAHIQRIEPGDLTVGEAILTEAKRFEAGCLVMGAYGHSHIGELILGGTTNHVLKHGSLPLLLSH
jgi:hypothetical protein